MKSIIEKLGLKTPENIEVVGDVYKVYKIAGLSKPHISDDNFFEQGKVLKKLIDDKNEMLEALILNLITHEDSFYYDEYPDIKRKRDIIEKATGKTWEEVKEIIENDIQ